MKHSGDAIIVKNHFVYFCLTPEDIRKKLLRMLPNCFPDIERRIDNGNIVQSHSEPFFRIAVILIAEA